MSEPSAFAPLPPFWKNIVGQVGCFEDDPPPGMDHQHAKDCDLNGV